MNYIRLNINSFFKNEKIIFLIIIICVISSAFIINFSYGMYYNYNTSKTEAELETKEIRPEVVEGAVLTKGDFQRYIESLSDDTLNAMSGICVMGYIDELSNFFCFNSTDGGGIGLAYIRFSIHDRQYDIMEAEKENYEESGRMLSGRFITSEEAANGSNVVIVAGTSADEWNEACLSLKTSDDTINLFGKEYQVIGVYTGGGGGDNPIVPFLTLPDDFVIDQPIFAFERSITRSMYNEMVACAMEQIPDTLVFPELPLPDTDTIDIYNNMISISLCISILSVINFAMLYHFIIKKRQHNLSIMRMCGCTKLRASFTYLGECITITLPSYVLGTLINIILTKNVLSNLFEFFEEAYSFKVYLVLFAVYFVAFIVILIMMITKTVSKSIVEEWKE